MNKKLSESIIQDTMKTNGIEVAPGNKGTITHSGLSEDTENKRGYTLFLRAAKYHEDELQDTDDLYDLMDRLSVDSEESPEDFSEEEIKELQDYLDTIPQEDIDKCWNEVHNDDLEENKNLKEDIALPENGEGTTVLELILPDELANQLQTEQEPEVVSQETVTDPLLELTKYAMSAEQSLRVLQHNLIGGEWFVNCRAVEDYTYFISSMLETLIQTVIVSGTQEPSIAEAIEEYPVLDVIQRNKQDTFTEIRNIFTALIELIESTKQVIPSDIQSRFEEWQTYLRTEADYKIVRGLQENYILVSNKDIKKKLIQESKLEDVKKDAEAECIKRGCDTYVYQLGEDIFYADEKPTDTRLVNKGILTLGKYRIGVSDGKPVATWFEESKITSNNKKSLEDLVESLQDNKTFEDPHYSDAVKDLEKEATYNKKNANVELGGELKNIPHEEFKGGKNPEEIEKAAKFDKKVNNDNQPIVNDIHKEFKHTAMNDIKANATYNHKELNVQGTPEGKNVESIGESKEIEDDSDLVSLEAYKAKHKAEIDLCYKNTYGEEVIKELYDSLAEYMYSTSITGGINNKKNYKTMNDKIKETEIAGHKINIIDNAIDGHEDNQPKIK